MMALKPVSTALLSYGMSGLVFHAPLLEAHPGFNLTTIVQRHANSARERWPAVRVARSVEEVFDDPSIELVIVNTPNATHHDFVARALRSGKHVVVEKPFTVTTVEADDLISLARKEKKILTVFHNRRWDGDFMTLKTIVDGNRVGRVVEYVAHYDRFRNYIERNTWKETAGKGTGILYNLGSHMLDQVLVLFGMPQEVDARVWIQREGGQVDDFYDVRLRYEGFYATVKSSYLVLEQGPRYVLHGTHGSFVKYGIDPQEQALKEGGLPGAKAWGKESPEWWGKLVTAGNHGASTQTIETVGGNYLDFYELLYHAIRSGGPVPVAPEDAGRVIRLIEACYESNRTGRAVTL